MNFSYPNSTGAYPQQTFYIPDMSNTQWLLQQPKDSGYASDDHDLFEKAFQGQFPSVSQAPTRTQHMSQTPMSAFSDSSSSEVSSSPFEYADSLCATNYNDHWNPYESLQTSVKKLSIDAGITSMTGYCDIDSLLTAAYHDTCPSQPHRFTSFSNRTSMSQDAKPSNPEPAEEETSPEPSTAGRPRGRVPHTAVEQRYRANLTDNFNRLRDAVPEIQTSQPARSGQPPRPSKAEVLAAAAEYIKQLEEENQQLRESAVVASELRRKRAKTG